MRFKFLSAMLIIAITLCIFSCGNNNTKSDNESDKSQNDTIIYNDNIQDTFFGTTFGASKDTLIKNFNKHKLVIDKTVSNNDWLSFDKYNSKISFGGYNWDYIYVSFSNDKFYSIQFHHAYKDKASALENYSNLLYTISSKYNMTETTPSDTTIYKKSIGYSKSNKRVIISCERYESIGHQIWQGVYLTYSDFTYYEVSNEL